jgi:hypothetical protein
MKKTFTTVIVLLLTAAVLPTAFCQNDNNVQNRRHSVRIGWGDMLFETMAFGPSLTGTWVTPESLPENYMHDEIYDMGYTGHIFAEYQYQLTKVVSLGAQADIEGIFWKEGIFDRYHHLIGPATNVRNWDLDLLLTARFTYFHRDWVRLYSGLGVGALFAFDNLGNFDVAPAFNINWIGVEVGKGPWGGTFELGGLNAIANTRTIYQVFSRIFSVSFYYKW